MSLQTVARTNVGKVREINEDYIFISEIYSNGVTMAIVADGMGGHLAGEVASKRSVEKISEIIEKNMLTKLTENEYKDLLRMAVIEANTCIYNLSQKNEKFNGMGTTIIVTFITDEWLILAHIGDSRAYLIKDSNYVQLTKDHSLVNELLLNGQITEEEALIHPQKNVLIRALGTDDKVEIDILKIDWEKDQLLLLCSDGLTNSLSVKRIMELINCSSLQLEQLADNLIKEANELGGEDNISLIIIKN